MMVWNINNYAPSSGLRWFGGFFLVAFSLLFVWNLNNRYTCIQIETTQFNLTKEETDRDLYERETEDLSCSCLMNQNCFDPYSIHFHHYTRHEVDKCFTRLTGNNQSRIPLVFVGDSRSKRLFFEVPHILGISKLKNFEKFNYERHHCKGSWTKTSSVSFQGQSYGVKHYWRNFIDGKLMKLIDDLKESCETQPSECPSFLFTDIHAHEAYTCGVPEEEALPRYVKLMSKYLKKLKTLESTPITVIYKHTDHYYEHLLSLTRNTHLVESVSTWMEEVKRLVENIPSIRFWDSHIPEVLKEKVWCNKIYGNNKMQPCVDGMHLPTHVYMHEMQIILNFMCNKVLYADEPLYCTESIAAVERNG